MTPSTPLSEGEMRPARATRRPAARGRARATTRGGPHTPAEAATGLAEAAENCIRQTEKRNPKKSNETTDRANAQGRRAGSDERGREGQVRATPPRAARAGRGARRAPPLHERGSRRKRSRVPTTASAPSYPSLRTETTFETRHCERGFSLGARAAPATVVQSHGVRVRRTRLPIRRGDAQIGARDGGSTRRKALAREHATHRPASGARRSARYPGARDRRRG